MPCRALGDGTVMTNRMQAINASYESQCPGGHQRDQQSTTKSLPVRCTSRNAPAGIECASWVMWNAEQPEDPVIRVLRS